MPKWTNRFGTSRRDYWYRLDDFICLYGNSFVLLIIAKVNPAFKKQAYIFFGIQQVLNFCGVLSFWLESLLGRNSGYRLIGFDSHRLYVLFARIDKRSTYLFVPYLIWCLYAGYLTIGLTLLNS